jgi:hypothetical protein
MDELFDSSGYIKVRHPDDVDIYPELMCSPVDDENVHPLYSSDTTGEPTGEPTGELAHGGNYPEIYQWTELYERGHNTYVRYCYSLNKVRGSKKTFHIPGGNSYSTLVKKRWVMVEEAIVRNFPPREIISMIKHWR